jgi:predicted transcriptional regulator of viral defense system
VAQVRAIYPDFHRGNFVQWQRAGYIVPLRQGWYAFADYIQQPDYARFIAGRICAPSYISLHTALSFYGIIPEAVVEITSVTTQKTCRYENAFGQFSYQTIRPRLFWGFEPKTMRDGKQYMMATPEKAIIDLLYLYPQYSTLDEMRELSFDDDWMREELNQERLLEYTQRISSPVINKRLKLLFKAYEIPDSVILSISFSTTAKVKQY